MFTSLLLTISLLMPLSANERFGATAAGRADLKGSVGKPPLRQAAIPLAAMQDDSVVVRVPYREWSTV